LHRIILVVLIGISILTTEYLYFCNKYYTSVITEDNYKMTIRSKPDLESKIIVGLFTMGAIGNILLMGWFTYRDHRKKVMIKSKTILDDIDY
jgi:hypothetical protein